MYSVCISLSRPTHILTHQDHDVTSVLVRRIFLESNGGKGLNKSDADDEVVLGGTKAAFASGRIHISIATYLEAPSLNLTRRDIITQFHDSSPGSDRDRKPGRVRNIDTVSDNEARWYCLTGQPKHSDDAVGTFLTSGIRIAPR